MRYLVLICLILPATAFSQTKSNAEQVMGKFMKFYNGHQDDSIYTLFSDQDKKFMSQERNAESIKWYDTSFGNMLSFKYLGVDHDDPDSVIVFKTSWSKGGKKTSSFSLDKENKFLDFRLGTSSPGITKLLKEEKNN